MRCHMPKPSRSRTTTSKEPDASLAPAPSGSTPSASLPAAASPSQPIEAPATLSDVDDLKPWIEVLAPPANSDVPGAGEAGVVLARVRVDRAAPDIELGNVHFGVDGVDGPYLGGNPEAASWEIQQELQIPYRSDQD